MSTTPYKLKINKSARGLKLLVNHNGLVVVARGKVSDAHIQKLIAQHQDWIDQQLIKFQPDTPLPQIGSSLQIGNQIFVYDGTQTSWDDLVKPIRKIAAKYLKQRTEQLTALHGFQIKAISIRDQISRWGSCSKAGSISLSWRLAIAPIWVGDYVILHELAHTKHFNHSKDFWAVVAAVCPDYKRAKLWFKQNGQDLRGNTWIYKSFN